MFLHLLDPYVSILPGNNADIFAASLLILCCNFLFLIIDPTVMNTFYICCEASFLPNSF